MEQSNSTNKFQPYTHKIPDAFTTFTITECTKKPTDINFIIVDQFHKNLFMVSLQTIRTQSVYFNTLLSTSKRSGFKTNIVEENNKFTYTTLDHYKPKTVETVLKWLHDKKPKKFATVKFTSIKVGA